MRDDEIVRSGSVYRKYPNDEERSIPLLPMSAQRRSEVQRPSLSQLLTGAAGDVPPSTTFYETAKQDNDGVPKFGTFNGVFVRCLLNIFSVLVFLSNGYIVGEAGLGLTLVIQIVSAFVTVVTTISASALCTNGRVLGGGPYYLVSRSLGVEFGSTLGIMFFLAQSIGIALSAVGFGQTVVSLMPSGTHIVSSDPNFDTAVIAVLVNIMVLVMCLFGVSWLNTVNLILSGVVYAGLFSFLIGACGGGRSPGYLDGYTGMRASTLGENFGPHFSAGQTFFTVASLFFPSCTGFLAGVNISGELENPSRSVPFGTLSALLANNITYLIQFLVIAASARYTLLISNSNFLIDISAWPPLVNAGIFAISLSSSLGAIVGAPRILAAVVRDGMFPWLGVFGRTTKIGDPINGYILSTVIACIFSVSGNLSFIAAVVTNSFLLVYGIINYSCFAASFARSPSWRPGFAYYNMWVSLMGTAVCLVLMFLIDYRSALVILGISLALFKFVEFRATRTGVRLGGASESYLYRAALKAVRQLQTNVSDSVKNFRPQLFLLENAVDGEDLQAAIRLVSYFYKSRALIMRGKVFEGDPCDHGRLEEAGRQREAEIDGIPLWKHDVLFCTHIIASDVVAGAAAMLQTTGIGRIRPNVLVCPLAFQGRDMASPPSWSAQTMVKTIRLALGSNLAVCVPVNCRAATGTDIWHPRRRYTGNIDVCWLADDGGLTPLLANLLQQSSYWSDCSLRFFLPEDGPSGGSEAHQLSELLDALRIKGTSHILPKTDAPTVSGGYSDHPFLQYLRPIHERSVGSPLVFVSLPVPAAGEGNGSDYAAFLQRLAVPNACTIFIRGNQSNVLTPYL